MAGDSLPLVWHPMSLNIRGFALMTLPIDRRGFAFAGMAGAGLAGVRVAGLTPVGVAVMGHAADGPMREIAYHNPLAAPGDVAGWTLEGSAQVSFPNGALNLENTRPPADGQAANIVFWTDAMMTGAVDIEWEFRPLREPGLCVLLMFANGLGGRDLFSPALAPRTGIYQQYIQGDIQNIGLSYFRRNALSERAFHICNLRTNPGFALRGQAADPLPGVGDWPSGTFYRMRVRKTDHLVEFFINDFPLLATAGDFRSYASGYLGFRQMAPLIGEYRNLSIYSLS